MILFSTHTCKEVYEMFTFQPDECAVICDEQRAPLSLVIRERFFSQVGTPFGSSLYHRQSITKLLEERPLLAEKTVPVRKMIDLALSRDEERLYDSIIVTDNGQLLRVVTVGALNAAIDPAAHSTAGGEQVTCESLFPLNRNL